MMDKIGIYSSHTLPSKAMSYDSLMRSAKRDGYTDIVDHFSIKRNGTTILGRPLNREGRAPGMVSICLEGGINEATGREIDNYTGDQFVALAVILRNLRAMFPGSETVMPRPPGKRAMFNLRKWEKETGV